MHHVPVRCIKRRFTYDGVVQCPIGNIRDPAKPPVLDGLVFHDYIDPRSRFPTTSDILGVAAESHTDMIHTP